MKTFFFHYPFFVDDTKELIKDYPEWWVVLTLDGFSSHFNVPEALEVFCEHNFF
jgi:hypothetical protein